jgi:hypothetical protein
MNSLIISKIISIKKTELISFFKLILVNNSIPNLSTYINYNKDQFDIFKWILTSLKLTSIDL